MRGGLHNHQALMWTVRVHIGTMISERTCSEDNKQKTFLAPRLPRTVERSGHTRAPFSFLTGGWPKMYMR
jgi:hypothetical protein